MFDINVYLKILAQMHVELQDTEEKPAFFREFSTSKILFDNSDFLNKMRYAKETVMVSQFNGEGRISGPNEDSLADSNSGAIYILTRANKSNMDEAQLKCKTILKDMVARIVHDKEQNLIPENVNFDLAGEFNNIGMIADSYYGVVLFLSYVDYSLCLQYNSDKWI